MTKKMLLIVVDACSSRIIQPALATGKLPNVQALAEAGSLQFNCSVIFPSITPAATSSIISGRYPRDHGIAGDFWYDIETNEVAYFGADLSVIWRKGPASFFEDFLVRLNRDRLQAQTLFQMVERAGFAALSLNFLIFRGDHRHEVDVPRLLKLVPGVPAVSEIHGPSMLRLGDFLDPDVEEVLDIAGVDLSLKSSGPLHRYGFQDQHTAQNLITLAREHALPDLTVAYFPDNDYKSHDDGPVEAVSALEQFDHYLGEFIEGYGGLDALLRDFCIVVTGDHSQSDVVADADEAGIDLDALLADYNVATAGTPLSEDDQFVICPNLRVAHIYFRQPTSDRITKLAAELVTDPRIDQVIWSAALTGETSQGFYVTTRDRGGLHFWPGRNGPYTAMDVYGCAWSWDGDLRAVDGQVADGVITFPTYPNAFERIACGLTVKGGGHIWVTAHPGYEFRLPGMEIHNGGGSHGSLHVQDSVVPLLLAGAPADLQMPAHPRTVDIVPLCLAIFGLPSHYAAGQSHVA